MNQCSCHYATDPNCAYHGDLIEERNLAADRLMKDHRWVSENFFEAVERIGNSTAYKDFIDEDDLSFCARVRAEMQKLALAEAEAAVEMRRAA